MPTSRQQQFPDVEQHGNVSVANVVGAVDLCFCKTQVSQLVKSKTFRQQTTTMFSNRHQYLFARESSHFGPCNIVAERFREGWDRHREHAVTLDQCAGDTVVGTTFQSTILMIGPGGDRNVTTHLTHGRAGDRTGCTHHPDTHLSNKTTHQH